MKKSLLDIVIGYISPEAGNKRLEAKGKTAFIARAYDAAKKFSTDDWTSATKGSANSEIRGAQETLRSKGRDAIRNNPYAGRGLNAIVSNTVGSGIVPNIKAKSKLQTKRLNDAWKEWGETPLCDSLGKNNFYAMQALVMRSTAESGEILAIKEINPEGMQIRLVESDHLVSSKDTTSNKDTGESTVQGVKVDNKGRVKSYFLYENHPGDIRATSKELEILKENICHVYREDRPGQLRGVSWFHPVIRQLEDFNEYQQATLISRKVGACFSAFITTNDTDSTLSAADLANKRSLDSQLSPASIRYLSNGESVELATPPAISGYDEYCRQTLRSIASGLGVTYEALTSDYSQVNFSSGRMGHIEFRRNVEMWRWSTLIPQFCDPAFKHFLKWCQIAKGIPIEGVSVTWCAPQWAMIDPTKEIAAMNSAVRSGLMSFQTAILELGYDPETHLNEIADNNKRLDELEIILDSDPRKTTQAGLFQMVQGEQNSQGKQNDVKDNEEDSSNGSPSDTSDGQSNN